jgi:serine/threonine protein kinase
LWSSKNKKIPLAISIVLYYYLFRKKETTMIVKEMDLTGQNISNYKVIEKLGSGGMATVYKAHELSLNRVVALKVLSSRLSQDEEYIKRFHREAQAAAKLNHPNIVQVYAIGESEGIHYFAMEYIKGESLADIKKEKNVIPATEAIAIIKPVAEALGEAHNAGLIHRDVKPSNIMIDASGRPKVTDFGIAFVTEAKTKLTQDGSIIGTPEYLSPEQCEGKAVDGRSDIYSLGVTLYEILSGQTPYQADTPVGMLMKIIKGNFAPLNEVNPDVPESVVKVVQKMMETDPQKRYADARELVRAIEEVEKSLTQPAVPIAEKAPVDKTRPEPVTAFIGQHSIEKKKSNLWPAITVAAIILLLLGGAFAAKVLYFDKKSEENQPSAAVETTTASVEPTASSAQTPGTETGEASGAGETTPALEQTEMTGSSDQANSSGDEETSQTTETSASELKDPTAPGTPGAEVVSAAHIPASTASGQMAEQGVQSTGTQSPSQKTFDSRSVNSKPVVIKKSLPPSNSVVVTFLGDDDKNDLITAYVQNTFSRDNFSVVDGPSVSNKDLRDIARYHLVVTSKSMGTETLTYYGNSTEQYSVAFTMKIMDTQTGKIASGPVSRVVKYTSLNAEENLKGAVQELAAKLKRSL